MKFRVIEEMAGRHPDIPSYPLFPGDIITPLDGAYMKHAPGLAVGGFVLSPEDIETRCEPAPDAAWTIV